MNQPRISHPSDKLTNFVTDLPASPRQITADELMKQLSDLAGQDFCCVRISGYWIIYTGTWAQPITAKKILAGNGALANQTPRKSLRAAVRDALTNAGIA